MKLLRGLLVALLLVALTQFGLASPMQAHAHGADGMHLSDQYVSAVEGFCEPVHGDHASCGAVSADIAHNGDGVPGDESGPADAHVHICPQFSLPAAATCGFQPVAVAATWTSRDEFLVTLAASPLQRPPSAIL